MSFKEKLNPIVQYWCPNCSGLLIKYGNYCHHCGKALDWETIKADESLNFNIVTPIISDPCKNCNNHPSNGGGGICNCTLATPKITYAEGK